MATQSACPVIPCSASLYPASVIPRAERVRAAMRRSPAASCIWVARAARSREPILSKHTRSSSRAEPFRGCTQSVNTAGPTFMALMRRSTWRNFFPTRSMQGLGGGGSPGCATSGLDRLMIPAGSPRSAARCSTSSRSPPASSRYDPHGMRVRSAGASMPTAAISMKSSESLSPRSPTYCAPRQCTLNLSSSTRLAMVEIFPLGMSSPIWVSSGTMEASSEGAGMPSRQILAATLLRPPPPSPSHPSLRSPPVCGAFVRPGEAERAM
mmetsp:Transcript_60043/g.190738  ORF Transcript_60043/g.190738 Transcript_60043/m.190738 type:complete len:267 (-) Transcript_60043:559-1359(-)